MVKEYTLYYWDQRLTEKEVMECLEKAWEDLYDAEYEGAFGAWRGVHYEVETDTVHITWDTMYAGPPLMISICRATGTIKRDFPREEFLLKEGEEIERLRNLPPGKR
jgi:hypothetical protein